MGKQTFNPDLLKKLSGLDIYKRLQIRDIVCKWVNDLAEHKSKGHDINFSYPSYRPTLSTNIGKVKEFGVYPSLWMVNLFAARTSYWNHPYIDNNKFFCI